MIFFRLHFFGFDSPPRAASRRTPCDGAGAHVVPPLPQRRFCRRGLFRLLGAGFLAVGSLARADSAGTPHPDLLAESLPLLQTDYVDVSSLQKQSRLSE